MTFTRQALVLSQHSVGSQNLKHVDIVTSIYYLFKITQHSVGSCKSNLKNTKHKDIRLNITRTPRKDATVLGSE